MSNLTVEDVAEAFVQTYRWLIAGAMGAILGRGLGGSSGEVAFLTVVLLLIGIGLELVMRWTGVHDITEDEG